jgi:hypothetical protein
MIETMQGMKNGKDWKDVLLVISCISIKGVESIPMMRLSASIQTTSES